MNSNNCEAVDAYDNDNTVDEIMKQEEEVEGRHM